MIDHLPGWILTLLISVALVSLERLFLKEKIHLTERDRLILTVQFLSMPASFLIAFFLLSPLVSFSSNFEVLSLSNLDIPRPLSMVLCFLVIDLLYYASHRIHHRFNLLWRLHRLHHSDREVDVLTSYLHHPLEFLSGYVLLTFAYVLLDLPLVVVGFYGLAFSVHVAFTHTKIKLPTKIDRWLSLLIVTPSMHRIHHLNRDRYTHSNFGQIFSFWDRLIGTYQAKVAYQYFGVEKSKSPTFTSLKGLIANPIK